jgi:hypothetical protein
MRLKLILHTSLFTALAALVTSCSNNSSVVDDWPGIDEMVLVNEAGSQALAPEDSFTLKSKLKLPKMGKDVEFELTTVCRRSDKEVSDPMKSYTKIIKSTAEGKEIAEELSVSEILPNETVIFPEFFNSCDISIRAKNSIGSTETKSLKNKAFSFSDADRELKAFRASAPNRPDKVIFKEDLSNLEIKHIDQIRFSAARMLCFSNSNTTENKIGVQTKLETIIKGLSIEIPAPKENTLVENCSILATDSRGNSFTSERFKLLNNTFSRPKVELTNYTAPLHGTEQFYYENSRDLGLKILGVKFSSNNSSPQKYKFSNSYSTEHTLRAIVGMKETSYNEKLGGGKSSYVELIKLLPFKTQWFLEDSQKEADSFNIKENESAEFVLNAEFGFKCNFPDTIGSLSSEIGAILSISKKSETFDIDMIEENDFTADIIETFNILKNVDKGSIVTASNLPTSSNFETDDELMNLIYRNNKIAPGEPLLMYHRVPATRPTDDSGTMTFNGPIDQYPFRDSSNVKDVTCQSELEEMNL